MDSTAPNMSGKKPGSSRNLRTALLLGALALMFFGLLFVRMAFFPH